jgi:ABC-2 type transport system ATP-binding protein
MSNSLAVAHNLSKTFGDRRVLDDLSFAIEPGDVIGVLGKNGAGKTTLLELMLGFSPSTAGSIEVFGHDSFKLPGDAKARVGYVPQVDELIDQLTARDQLRVIGSFYAKWDSSLLERLSIEWELDLKQRVRELSIGQRQKLSILLALGHRPDLLMLDEPVASLDPIARRQFLEQIVEIAADGQRAVVFSSHIVSDIERLANKIWILKNGKLFWQGDLDALKESVVRIHVRSQRDIPGDFRLPNGLSLHREGNYARGIVSAWSVDSQRALEDHLQVKLEVETLPLEEIFLELHQ